MQIVRTGDGSFNFFGADGSAPSVVASVGVTGARRTGPIWWIVADEYSELWGAGDVLEVSELTAGERQRLYKRLEVETTGARLTGVTYGVVPQGFRQLIPASNHPAPLQRGARYVLHFLGSETASLEFDF
jgi:hypothetical protein